MTAGMPSVLVVEDYAPTRRMLTRALERRGHEVRCACSGREALEILHSRPFTVVVSDIHMPDLDGLSLCEMARALRPQTGFILVTGFHTEESVLRAFRGGASAYLRKPINLHTLYKTVQQVAENLEDLPDDRDVTVEQGPAPEGAAEGLGLLLEEDGWVHFTAPSHRAFLDRFANLCELLLGRGMDQDTIDEIRVAILELGANAIEWGHGFDATKPVRLSARLLPDRLVIVVEDRGRGFKLDEVPDPARAPRKLQRMRAALGKRPGGYGIALVRAIMDEVVYTGRGNVVAMVKRLRPKPVPG